MQTRPNPHRSASSVPSGALPADSVHTDLQAYLWTKATGHPAGRPISCAACDAVHLRDCLLRIVSPTRDLIAALCDGCAAAVRLDMDAVEALIDERGRAGRFCDHMLSLDGYTFAVVDADCPCGRRGAA